MSGKKKFVFFTVALLFIGVLNFWCRKKLPYAYVSLYSYNTLYTVKEQFNVTYLGRLKQDSILIRFSGSAITGQNDFQVFCGGKKIAETNGPDLRMRPSLSPTRYKIRINNKDSFEFQMEIPDPNGPAWFTSFQLLVKEPPSSVTDWAWKGMPGSREDREYADRVLRDSMQVRQGQTAREKVIRMARYLLSRTVEKRGVPALEMAALSPLSQWQRVLSGKSLLYCGNYAVIFADFASRAGVPCRLVQCGSSELNGVTTGNHVFDEVYLGETGGWAYLDLMDGNVLVQKNGRLLNTIDIQRLLRFNGTDPGFTALRYNGDSLVELPFRDASVIARDFFNPNTTFTFYYGNYTRLIHSRNPWEKIVHFLYPGPYWAIYSDNTDLPGYELFLRLATQYSFIAGLAVWLFLLIGMFLLRLKIFQIGLRR